MTWALISLAIFVFLPMVLGRCISFGNPSQEEPLWIDGASKERK